MGDQRIIRAAIIGYGGAFNMGTHHTKEMQATGRMKLVAVCDKDSARTDAAKAEWEGIETFNEVSDLIEWGEFDLAINILPHNLHAEIAIQCSKAGKHVIVEKPMCVSVQDATDIHSQRQDDAQQPQEEHEQAYDLPVSAR